MREVGANIIPIQSLINQIQSGISVQMALNSLAIPFATKVFVLSTMTASFKSTHEIAATFLLGREDIIPSMFQQILQSLDNSSIDCQHLSLYLERHTHLDDNFHRPMSEQLLKNLCKDDDEKWEQSTIAAEKALRERISLWDGVVSHILNTRKSALLNIYANR